jgi:hypothetical protein
VPRPTFRRRSGLALLLAAALGTSCNPSGSAPGPAENLLVNPGFEAGREGWSWVEASPDWHDFRIAETPVRTGQRALHLPVERPADAPPSRAGVFGVYQELRPQRFPERLGGFYRVERWEKSDPAIQLYVQAVAIVTGDPRAPALVAPGLTRREARNYQLRYYLAGLAEPAFHLRNAHVVFESTAPPRLHEWTRFEVPLRRDVERLWAGPPAQYETLRVLFEARWDAMPTQGWVRADVYFDDLFLE